MATIRTCNLDSPVFDFAVLALLLIKIYTSFAQAPICIHEIVHEVGHVHV